MQTISFIGAGNLANCLIDGLVRSHPSRALAVSDIAAEKTKALQARFPDLGVYDDAVQMVRDSDVVVLCVKPDAVSKVCTTIRDTFRSEQKLLISVAAGVTTSLLRKWLNLGEQTSGLLRCMPNLPVAVGAGMSVLYADASLTKEHRLAGEAVFGAVGEVAWVQDEKLMDIVTALSGSGPAYFFRVIHALEQAAQNAGIDAELARRLTQQTAAGAALYAQKNAAPMAELCARVASKGGTTEAALRVMDQAQVDQLFARVLAAATQRAQEISAQMDKEK